MPDTSETDPIRRIARAEDVPAAYRGTAVEALLRAHDLGEDASTSDPMTLITCMDPRIRIEPPGARTFVLRAGAGAVDPLAFDLAVSIGVAKVRTIAVVGHTDCTMARVGSLGEQLRDGLAEVGWDADETEALFDAHAPHRGVGDIVAFTLAQVKELRERYPGVLVAPLLYHVEDHHLSVLDDGTAAGVSGSRDRG